MIENTKLSFLNVKNLKANLVYSKFLAIESDILYMSELWCKQNEINLLKTLIPDQKSKSILFKSDIEHNYKKGRPFGGQAWILNKSYTVLTHEFLSRHLSYIQIKKNGVEFMIIGIYMPFDNSKKRDESLSTYEMTLNIISTLISKAKILDIPIFILGDFNADPNRNNRFDKLLKSFMANQNLQSVTSLYPQSTTYTYKAQMKQDIIKSNIDHIFIINDKNNSISVINCLINDDIANMSDHNSISCWFENKLKYQDPPPAKPKPFQVINFENPDILNFFNQAIESQFLKLSTKPNPTDNLDDQETLDYLHETIHEIIGSAETDTLTYQDSLSHNNSHPNKSKPWFTHELKVIKSRIMILKNTNSNPNTLNEIKKLRKEFRRIQRKNIYELEKKELLKFESIARKKDKSKFWKFIKSKRKSRSSEKTVSSSPQKLFEHYSKFFNENYSNLTEEQKIIETKVNQIFQNYKKPNSIPTFTPDQLEMVIKNLKTSNVKGHDSISYSLLKNINSTKFLQFLLDFFNRFLTTGTIPRKLNYSLIKPILKDQNKNTDDTNNIRPLSISNCLAQIFERLILINSPSLNKSHKNQFGFKKLTSCNHAIFTMKETILHYTQNKTACKIASLDAEKAFDKVWRTGIFYKLTGKIDSTYWYVLKKYYDSSKGVILNLDYSTFSEFEINCGVKQGGILSPFLFNIFIDDLIHECVESQMGALFNNINVSIIVYADDILLISPVDSQLQTLLNICSKYSNLWRIKFNASKSNIIMFGKPVFPDNKFFINNSQLTNTEKLKYLGIEIDSNLDFNNIAKEKFKKVNKSIFSLSYLGLTPNGIPASLKAFLYKTYCLSQFTYALETTTLNHKTKHFLNISQNNIIRQILGLKRFCHMSNILKCLRIYDFNTLYIKSKLSFLESIKKNEICSQIFNFLCHDLNNTQKNSKSFQKDIIMLQSHFCIDIELIFAGPTRLRDLLNEEIHESDGLCDSIMLCLNNINNKFYKNLLDNLIQTNFLDENYLTYLN
jgi:hypothetical protein